MVHHKHERKQRQHLSSIFSLGISDVLIAFAFAAFETVWALFIYEFFPNQSAVGFIGGILSFLLLLALAFLFPLFRYFKTKKLFFISIAGNSILLALFAFTHNKYIFFIIAIINVIFQAIRIQSFGILLRENSSLKNIAKNENLMYLLANIGWVVGPLIAGFIADEFSVRTVLIFSALFMLLSEYSITFSNNSFNKYKETEMKHISPLNNLIHFFRRKKRITSYLLSLGLEIWWVVPYIFIPIKMINEFGFNVKSVGLFLFILCIPLIFIELILKKKNPQKLKRIIGFGYIITGFFGVIAGLASNIYIILGAIIMASFGLGFIEPSSESHFFKIVKKEQSKRYFGTFMTSKTVGLLIGQVLVACVLLFASFSVSLFIISGLMFALAILAFHKKKRKHKKKK
ncbi:MAG: MFS transporter [Patescibacteria group bacterium]|nr:MFS transporter [Patescibacteria group bacterium]